MKRTREDEPSKARRGWKRGRPAQNGDGSPPAAKPKRSSRSVFGPSGEDRPDVLTDAETVVLPLWLHRRTSSADGSSAGSAASFLKTITVPAQGDQATRPAPGAGAAPKTGAAPETKAAPETGAAPETSEPPETTGTARAPRAGTGSVSDDQDAGAEAREPRPGDLAGADQGRAEPPDAKPGEAGAKDASPGEAAEAKVADAEADTIIRARPATPAKADAEADTIIRASAATASVADPDANTVVATVGRTAAPVPADRTEAEPAEAGSAEAEPTTPPAAESPGGGTTGAKTAGPNAPTLPSGTRPDAEATTTLSRAELKTAMVQARTLEAIEAIEAIDALETSTLGGLEARTAKALNTVEAISALEARTAQAIKTIEAMTADALEAIDATAAEVTPELTSKLVSPDQAGQADGDEAETPAPDGADSAGPDRAEATSSARAGDAGSSPGTDIARTRVIHIDEPPASVTLVTSATETIIALPHPRAESLVSVAPAPPATTTAPLPLVPSAEPAALPSAEPQPEAEPRAKPRRVRWSRRTRVSRGLLLGILCLQAILSLRLHRSAFEDEALYLYSGHMELEHLLHGSALQGTYASYFSGAPVLYPVAAAAVNQVGGLAAVRALSLIEMLATTTLLYALTRRLFNERIALCAAALFSVTASAIFLGDFATYDATCLFLLATAAWIMVRTAVFRWPVFLLAAPVAALAVGVKYAGLLFVPTIAVLPALAGWPARGWRVLLYPPAFVAAVGGLLYAGLRVGGHAYQAAISQTTTNRAQGVVPVTTFLREFAEWGGVIFVLAVIGTVAYIWRVRTEPDEHIATVGGRFWRTALGVVLTGTALLAPLYQAHLHTDISFQKHIGFGLFFAAPIAGLGLSRILGDHLRHPHVGVAAWCLALVLGLTWSGEYFQVWPDSGQFVQAFSTYLKPNGRYLVEAPEVPIYYLENNPDAQPRQFYSTYYLSYTNKKGVTQTGPAGYVSALKDGYFQTVVYYFQVTPPVDGVLAHTLATSRSYYLAAEIGMNDSFGAGDYFVWVKGHAPAPAGVFAHASSKYPDLGTKLRELAP